jgi:hypothetical protein
MIVLLAVRQRLGRAGVRDLHVLVLVLHVAFHRHVGG